jgi:hypothetical protein
MSWFDEHPLNALPVIELGGDELLSRCRHRIFTYLASDVARIWSSDSTGVKSGSRVPIIASSNPWAESACTRSATRKAVYDRHVGMHSIITRRAVTLDEAAHPC